MICNIVSQKGGTMRRSWMCVVALAACLADGEALAQSWPSKRVQVIVPFTAGSSTDIIARTVTLRLSEGLGQPFVVENRPGAGGTIGMAAVAKADPDGHTILVHSSSYTITPSTYPNTPYDTLRDLAGITPLALVPNVLVISPAKGIRTVQDLVRAAKAKPGAMNYASAGVGTATQLNGERFRLGAGIDVVHVPFKGTPEALTEVIAGRVDYYFCPVNAVLPLVAENKLLALAVGSTKRSAALPDVPTTVEARVPNSDYNFWVGMAVPSKTPRNIVNRLHQETAKALSAEAVRDSMAKLGAEPMLMRPDEFDAYIRNEINTNAELVKAAGIASGAR
jgi:tripartite-type tricarboxylate transporter receptor subunit TctC